MIVEQDDGTDLSLRDAPAAPGEEPDERGEWVIRDHVGDFLCEEDAVPTRFWGRLTSAVIFRSLAEATAEARQRSAKGACCSPLPLVEAELLCPEDAEEPSSPVLDAVPLFFSILCEVDATEFFEDEGPDYAFCVENAGFHHDTACEFVVHIGPEGKNGDTYKDMRARMDDHVCSPRFIQVYEQAAAAGASRVLFYAG